MNRILVVIIAILVFSITVIWINKWQNQEPPLPILDTLGGEFILPSTLEKDVSLSDFKNKVVLLNFGYTSCPHVCPTVLARMRDAMQQLPESSDVIQPLFVTLNPESDSQEVLKKYVTAFYPQLVGLSGTPEQIRQVAAKYRVFYQRQSENLSLDDSETMDELVHSDHIYLIDGLGRVRATFGNSVSPQEMASTIQRLVSDL